MRLTLCILFSNANMKSWDWPSACCIVFNHILNWSRTKSFCSWSFRKSFFWLEERRHPWKNIDIKVENIKFWGMIWCTVVILDRWATFVEIVLYKFPVSSFVLSLAINLLNEAWWNAVAFFLVYNMHTPGSNSGSDSSI